MLINSFCGCWKNTVDYSEQQRKRVTRKLIASIWFPVDRRDGLSERLVAGAVDQYKVVAERFVRVMLRLAM